jgi:D-tyrosyl-tRNA(Tyr) deacylase
MRAVVQRVSSASIDINKVPSSSIKQGLVVLIGIEPTDTEEKVKWMVDKIIKLRIFNDDEGKMNRSVQDIDGDILLVSQFTLYGDCRKGTRPSFINAAKPEIAIPLYEKCIELFNTNFVKKIETGEFGAHMDIHLVNDGPVTLILEK